MAATFNFDVDFSARQSSKPRVRTIQFGDGYSQRLTYGLNTDLKEWSLTFAHRSTAEIQTITGFLEARRGSEAFYWTSPYGETSFYVCQEWDVEAVAYDINTLTATFKEVPDI